MIQVNYHSIHVDSHTFAVIGGSLGSGLGLILICCAIVVAIIIVIKGRTSQGQICTIILQQLQLISKVSFMDSTLYCLTVFIGEFKIGDDRYRSRT